MSGSRSRVLIAGTGSGRGKTTVSCAVMGALKKRGLRVAAFKCGPDYIDPMFHTRVVGVPSRNLDLYFLDKEGVSTNLALHSRQADISILEGVMGFYDGVAGTSRASSCHLASATHTPVLLVADCKGMSLSLAALVGGYQRFAPNTIRGVILNRASAGGYPALRRLIEDHTGLPVLGYLPVMENAGLESRHLGLVTAGEVKALQTKVDAWAAQAEETLELDRILQVAAGAPPLEVEQPSSCGDEPMEPRVPIGVAMDEAFCFYYQDNLDLLEACGAELVPFSPLHDRKLPAGLRGLYLGGGYPELFLPQLSGNTPMLESMREALKNGACCIAECGGFLYLHASMDGGDGAAYPLVGWHPAKAAMSNRLGHFGYARLTANQDTLLLKKGEKAPVHEFHYCKSDGDGQNCTACKETGKQWDCVAGDGAVWAGFPHLYFGSYPLMARRFVNKCRESGG